MNQKQTGTLNGVSINDGETRIIKEVGKKIENIYQKQFEGFCDAIEGKLSYNADAKEMVFIQQIAEAAYKSSDQGKHMELSRVDL